MELNQLKYFQTVAHTRSVTKAAEELFVSQSTLSQCISRLENSVGCPLFFRQKGKKLQLTDAGKAFLGTVDQVLSELDQGVGQALLIGNGYAPQISIASALRGITGFLVTDFLSENEHTNISYKSAEINSLKDLLINQEIDFALAPCPAGDDRIECVELYPEEVMLNVGPNHPLRGKKHIKKSELLNESFICNFGEIDRFFLLKMLFKDHHINIIAESDDNATIRDLVNANAGVTLVPAGVARNIIEKQKGKKEQFLKISDHETPIPYCIWKKKNKQINKEAEQFYQFILDYAKTEAEKNERFIKSFK